MCVQILLFLHIIQKNQLQFILKQRDQLFGTMRTPLSDVQLMAATQSATIFPWSRMAGSSPLLTTASSQLALQGVRPILLVSTCVLWTTHWQPLNHQSLWNRKVTIQYNLSNIVIYITHVLFRYHACWIGSNCFRGMWSFECKFISPVYLPEYTWNWEQFFH